MFETLVNNLKTKIYSDQKFFSSNNNLSEHHHDENRGNKDDFSILTSKFNILNFFRHKSGDNDCEYERIGGMFPRVVGSYSEGKYESGIEMWPPSPILPSSMSSSLLSSSAPCYNTSIDRNEMFDKFIRIISDDEFSTRFNHRRNDREEIRRRLAMGDDQEYFKRSAAMPGDKPARKPSLQSRLQNGMNLQICFMNETVSDNESPSSDSETCPNLTKSKSTTHNYTSNSSFNNPYSSRPLSVSKKANINGNKTPIVAGTKKNPTRPASLSLGPPISDDDGSDFFTKQARLQIEARMALSQAKDMAHMQMEIERQKQKQSPITEVIRNSLEKVGINLPAEKRRVSRQMLTDMNIAQLQIIVNELHTQIEVLNENLVEYLMERDDLHMSQDSMLVDIEDLTRYLGAKEQTRNPSTKPLPLSSSTSSLKSKTLQLKASQIGSGTHLPSSNSTILELSQNDNKSPRSSSTSNISSLTTNQTSTTAALSSSPSSHSQLLQNKFLRIANLVKK